MALSCVLRVSELIFFLALHDLEYLLSVHMEFFCLFCLTTLPFRLLRLFDWDGICFLNSWNMQLTFSSLIPVFSPFFLKVSFAAHIAGGFAGMSIGYTVFSCFDKALLKDPRFWIAIAAYLACVLFAVFFSIFLSPANWLAPNTKQLIKRAIWEKTGELSMKKQRSPSKC